MFASLALAQDKPLPGSSWGAISELPNFVGVWETSRGGGGPPAARPEPMALTAPYLARQKEYQAHRPEDSPQANCVPPGMPSIMTQPYPIEILFTPGKVTILIEAYEQIRHIYTDGRKLPDDPDLTFNGTSIGHWEGDTLVAESVGFAKETVLGAGAHHSDKLKITERIKLSNPNLLEIATTMQDPEALTKPYTVNSRFARHADWTLAEYVCQQNNRNSVSLDGKAGIDLSH
ncbi:MAG: hypothetical protein ABI824_15710 [Acidobacteriota bacterium]